MDSHSFNCCCMLLQICKRASFHLEHIDVQQSDQIGGPVIPAANLVGLINKARIRKGSQKLFITLIVLSN